MFRPAVYTNEAGKINFLFFQNNQPHEICTCITSRICLLKCWVCTAVYRQPCPSKVLLLWLEGKSAVDNFLRQKMSDEIGEVPEEKVVINRTRTCQNGATQRLVEDAKGLPSPLQNLGEHLPRLPLLRRACQPPSYPPPPLPLSTLFNYFANLRGCKRKEKLSPSLTLPFPHLLRP